MFETLTRLQPDPILSMSQEYEACQHPKKTNLSIGVYQNNLGVTPIFKAVKQAEQILIESQKTKVYIPQQGPEDFLQGMKRLLLGSELIKSLHDRTVVTMAAGGSGALRIASEVAKVANPDATIWISDPSWANHYALMKSVGLKVKKYPYYNSLTGLVDFEKVLSALSNVPSGDIVLFHTCCHNPTGADLTVEQWELIISLADKNGFLPFFDTAYQGFSESLEKDVYPVRLAAKVLPEVMIASSCSKNFGLYRERVGCVLFVNKNAQQAEATHTQAIAAMRVNYSMSPYHGGGIVGLILKDNALKTLWENELNAICSQIKQFRQELSQLLNNKQSHKDFSFIQQNHGMFSFLGIRANEIQQLRDQYGVYLLDSSRINLGGLSKDNIEYVASAIADVMND